MPMGLTNSPATFQRAMNMLLSGLNWVSCLVYIDDIVVFSKTEEEHLNTLEEIFTRLEAFGFSLKKKKCNFFAREVEYLGHVVSAEGRKPHPRNLMAVQEFKTPRSITDVQSFLGLCNYYSQYIPEYTQKVEPLQRLLKTGIAFVWSEEQQECFATLQRALCSAPVLRFPDFEKRFIIQTDACGYGIGAVLTQEFEDGEHPILFLSRSLSEPERKWAARELEALAVVWAVTTLRPYIEGREFTVQTDHESLQWLMRTETPGRLSRWALKLQEFLPQMVIEYRRGKDNGNADVLSRNPLDLLNELPEDMQVAWVNAVTRVQALADLHSRFSAFKAETNSIPVFAVHTEGENEDGGHEEDTIGDDEELGTLLPPSLEEMVSDGYTRDAKWRALRDYLVDPAASPLTGLELEQMRYRALHFSLENGLLYLHSYLRRNTKDPRVLVKRLVVPDDLRGWIVSFVHDRPAGVHFGSSRVSPLLRWRLYFPNMDRYVRDYIATCDRCQKAKATRQLNTGHLNSKGVDEPGMLSVDLQGPFPTASNGKNTILTLKDIFLGLVVLIPLTAGEGGAGAAACVDAIMERWVPYFGLPRIILSDQGPQFEAEMFQHFCKRLGVKKFRTSTYHPETNSDAERQQGFHTPLLKALTDNNPRGWPTLLPYLQFSINSSPQEGSGVAPLEGLTSFPPLIPLDIYLTPTKDYSFDNDKHQYKLEHPKRVRFCHGLMKKVKKEQREKREERYNNTHRDVQFSVGELVLAYKPANVTGPRKLAINFRGPFEVMKVLGKGAYRIRLFRAEPPTEWTANVKNMVRYRLRSKVEQTEWDDIDGELPAPPRTPHVSSPDPESGGGEKFVSSFTGVDQEEQGVLELRNLLNASVFFAMSGNRGVGAYARRSLPALTTLVEYTGENLTAAQHGARYPDPKQDRYSMQASDNLFIDAEDFRLSSWARYVNAPGPQEKANVRFVSLGDRVYIQTLMVVPEGEELLVDYGRKYAWAGKKLAGDGPKVPPARLDLRDVLPAMKGQLEELALGLDPDSKQLPDIGAPEDVPALMSESEEEWEEVEDQELEEVEQEQEEKGLAPKDNDTTIPPGFKVGDFGLFQLEAEEEGGVEKPLWVARITSFDELAEFANVHLYQTYTPGRAKARFAPVYTDPKDGKAVYQQRPKPRFHAQTAQVYAMHFRSAPFVLERRGLLPEEVEKVLLNK